MFHVAATHPPALAKHAPLHHQPVPSSSSSSSSPALQLPRTLSRPPFAEVSHDAIAAAAPELASVPPEYIRCSLIPRAKEMLAGNAAISHSRALPPSLPRTRLPSSLSIPISSSSSSYPTHILALTPSKSPAPSDSAVLIPVHALVLAAHCASLPRLPPSPPPSHSTLTLPVLPLAVPSTAAFSVLHAYMYSRRPDKLLAALFPIPPAFAQPLSPEAVRAALASRDSLHQLSSFLCTSAARNIAALMAHAAHVKDLWQDSVALGIHDPALWDTMDLAWEVVLGALNLAAM